METKICVRCGKHLPVTSFWKGGNGRKRRPECGKCSKKSRKPQDRREYERTRRQERKQKLYDELKHPCVICGESDPVVIHFHHLDPNTKSFGVASGIGKYSWRRIEQEVKKCICVCANCHARIHAGTVEIPT